MHQMHMHVETDYQGVVNRRAFIRTIAAGALGVLGWRDTLALHATELRRRDMACILLFMRGGPSQFETFDPNPGTANGGPTQAISTAVPGIRIANGWSKVAAQMNHVALIRSMTSREGEHQRAVYQMHTGYIPAGGVRHPSLGALVAKEIAPRDFDLPHFVKVGNANSNLGAGFLGAQFAPFLVPNPNQPPANVALPLGVTDSRFGRRLELLNDLEQYFSRVGGEARVNDHRALYNSAANMVRSPHLRAFDLTQESAVLRAKYGQSAFGQGCLLARRLVETGVTFVEVESNGWDTHQDNFTRSEALSNTVDAGFAALIEDLRDRGRLDRTLIIWMGEFGRSPAINASNGRGHFPRAFNVALAGGGIQGGRVIGATNANGTDITNRPVAVADLFNTFCQSLGIDGSKENHTPQGRPIHIVNGGSPVRELFS